MERTPRRAPARSESRDDDVRAVSRATKAVVAVAVIGVGAFAGLAATGQTQASSAVRGSAAGGGSAAAAQDQGSGQSTDGGWWEQQQQQAPTSDDGYSDDGYSQQAAPSDQGFAAPQSPPSYSQLPPVGGSGGS